MSENITDVVISIDGSASHFNFTPRDIAHLASGTGDALRVLLLPSPKPKVDAEASGYGEQVTVNIVVYATLAYVGAKLVEGFLKEAGSDVYKFAKGKLREGDITSLASKALRSLLAKLIARNETVSYRVHQDLRIVCQLNDEQAMIRVWVDARDFLDDPNYAELRNELNFRLKLLTQSQDCELNKKVAILLEEYAMRARPIADSIVANKLASLAESWPKIMLDIEALDVGSAGGMASSPSGFHIIQEHQDGCGASKWAITAYSRDMPEGAVRRI